MLIATRSFITMTNTNAFWATACRRNRRNTIPTFWSVLETTWNEGIHCTKSNKRLNQPEIFLLVIPFIQTYKYYWSRKHNETLVMGWGNYALFEYLTPNILIVDKVLNATILRHSLLEFSSNKRHHELNSTSKKGLLDGQNKNLLDSGYFAVC